jgi:SpoVK/Ycf46/Vps4 family AAA+-type ATPase
VLVLDDADDLLEKRSEQKSSTASADRAIVNTILQELSGFGGRIPGVLVVLTTNRFDHLDEAVRSRVPLHVRVPYPLEEKQVGEVVDAVAARYAFDLSAVRQKLVQRFFATIHQELQPPKPEAADENRFSPRDIEQAMLLLRNPDGSGRIRPDDFERMRTYFDRLPQPQHLLKPRG